MRTVVWTGSRGWQDVQTLEHVIVGLRRPFRSIVGDADGLDLIVWELLASFSLPRWRFKAQWKSLGKSAGHARNRRMLDQLQKIDPGGFVLAGWDGESRGTKGCMDEARRRGIDVWPITYIPNLNEG